VRPQVSVIKDEGGNTLTESDNILARWKRYCEGLYTDREWEKGSRISGPKEPCPMVEEVERSIGDLKPGKVVGPDDIPAELLKLRLRTVVKAMHRLIQIMWETGKWPNAWNISI
jgi:hypothetical protein